MRSCVLNSPTSEVQFFAQPVDRKMKMSPIMSKTVCMNCRHHNGADQKSAWFNHKCLAPDNQKQEEQDPVSGLIMFSGKNSLGVFYMDDQKHPFCRDHNRGNCEHYEGKTRGMT